MGTEKDARGTKVQGRGNRPSATWIIFKKEAVDILRDRRAVFFSLVLPLLLYPVFYFAFSSAMDSDRGEKTLHVGVSGDDRGFVDGAGEDLEFHRKPEFDLAALRAGDVSLFLEFASDGDSEGPGTLEVTLHYLSSSPDSTEALRRLQPRLDRLENRLLEERFADKGARLRPRELVVVETADISTPGERGLWRLGRFLPVLLVILLLSGGSVVALDLVAGEKERGTLETLYVHPVSVRSIVWGKFLVLLVASIVSVALNLLGLLISFQLGQALGVGNRLLGGGVVSMPPLSTIGLIFLLVLPLSVLTSAVLLVISALSRSFREAQVYLLPVTLLALALVLPVLSPSARLASVVCVVPLANLALAMREALEGNISLIPTVIALVSSCVYAAATLGRAAGLLWREDVVLSLEPPVLARDSNAEGRANRALLFGAFLLLVMYFAGSRIQKSDPYGGLAITLWVLVLVPALLYPLALKLPFRETLALRGTRWVNYLVMVPLMASTAVLVTVYMAFQNLFLQLPHEILEAFEEIFRAADLGTVPAVLLFVISPAICEELLWRGSFQGELEPRRRTATTVVLVGLFFGLFHQSIYRILPTAILGGVLAFVRHRTGSIFPCMLLHALYNGALLASFRLEQAGVVGSVQKSMLQAPCILGATVVLPLCLLALRPPRPSKR